MSLGNIRTSGKTFNPADENHNTTPYFRRGWSDKATNADFPKDYERWPRFGQTGYEKGRMMALCVFMETGIWLAPPSSKNYELISALAQDFFDMQKAVQKLRAERKAELERQQLAEHGICEVY